MARKFAHVWFSTGVVLSYVFVWGQWCSLLLYTILKFSHCRTGLMSSQPFCRSHYPKVLKLPGHQVWMMWTWVYTLYLPFSLSHHTLCFCLPHCALLSLCLSLSLSLSRSLSLPLSLSLFFSPSLCYSLPFSLSHPLSLPLLSLSLFLSPLSLSTLSLLLYLYLPHISLSLFLSLPSFSICNSPLKNQFLLHIKYMTSTSHFPLVVLQCMLKRVAFSMDYCYIFYV